MAESLDHIYSPNLLTKKVEVLCDVGVVMVFQSNHDQPLPDLDVYQNELAIARLAESLGYDSSWVLSTRSPITPCVQTPCGF